MAVHPLKPNLATSETVKPRLFRISHLDQNKLTPKSLKAFMNSGFFIVLMALVQPVTLIYFLTA
jgi:hypothetical protein